MRDFFWLLLLFPVVWPFIAKLVFGSTVNWQETFLAIGISVGSILMVWYSGTSYKAHDTEFLNGEVTGKTRVTVPCNHDYKCNCEQVKDSDGKGGTHEECDTCYDHDHDYNWVVATTLGDIKIARSDRQGKDMPERYGRSYASEPVAVEHGYDNWVIAVDSSLFHASPALAAKYGGKLPAYPMALYDDYRVNRLVTDGVEIADAARWNEDIADALKELGPKKQANIVIVVTADPSSDYADALRASWQGAKKNDVVTVIGAPEYPKIAWAKTFSWSKNDIVNIAIRDRLQELGKVDRAQVMAIVTDEIRTDFVRRSFKEFEYLKDEIDPPLFAVILAFLISVPGSLFLSWWFHKHEVDFLNR
jgi:hypothetical protein